MAEDSPLDQQVTQVLQARNPLRVAVFLRTKSPLYALEREEVVSKACDTIGVDRNDGRAKLLTEWKTHRMTIFAFDLWNDGYDWVTAHHEVDLPVVLVDYGKRLSSVKLGGRDFSNEVNKFVADQHRLHGWEAKPPYFQDQTGPAVPTYGSPRDMKMVLEDGTRRRAVLTPPPEAADRKPC